MFVKGHCSPRIDNESITCLSKKILIKIAKILNKEYDSNINIHSSKKKLFNHIQTVMSKHSSCLKESCWSQLNLLFNNLSKEDYNLVEKSFKPFQPKKWKENPNTWLTTHDIDNVMEQYEKKYPYFQYIGATPIDFHLKNKNGSCLVSELCHLNIKELKKNKKKSIGLVFNIDPHNKPGQHWFSMYIDMVGKNRRDKPSIYFFDSAKAINDIHSVPQQILDFIEKIQNNNNYSFDVLYNDIQHQYGDTECGMYCLHFLIHMLKGMSFHNYIQRKLTDKKMEKFRKKYFIQSK